MDFNKHALANNQLLQILDASDELFFVVDVRSKLIVHYHQHLEFVTGFSKKELLHKQFSEFLQSENVDPDVKSTTNQKQYFFLKTKSNKLLRASVRMLNLEVEDGKDASVCYFINLPKKQEKELEMLDLSTMFQMILDTIPARIFWKDKNLVYQGCNNQFARDAGMKSKDEILGKTDFDLSWKKEEAEFFRSIDRRVISSGKAELQFVEPQLQADGTEAWLETNKVPLRDKNGEIIGILGTYSDITNRKKTQDLLKRHTKELENKNQELEQFAYIASHDLQEPLRTLSSFVDLFDMEFGSQLDESGKTYLNYIKDSSNRMRSLITGLLEYSRLGRDPEKKEVDISELVKEIQRDFSKIIYESKADIVVGNLPKLYACETELRILFQNIIQNAIKFHKQDVTPKIHISGSEKDQAWEFIISDNGIGIAPEYKEKIFTIFQRLHAKSAYRGNGIGLAYCKKIVDLMGGNIWVDSEEGKGSAFCFTLPKIDES